MHDIPQTLNAQAVELVRMTVSANVEIVERAQRQLLSAAAAAAAAAATAATAAAVAVKDDAVRLDQLQFDAALSLLKDDGAREHVGLECLQHVRAPQIRVDHGVRGQLRLRAGTGRGARRWSRGRSSGR
jgi:hypothetical protein